MPGAPDISGTKPKPPLRWILRRISRTPHARRMMLAEAVMWLGIARVALVALPFHVLAARFGIAHSPAQAAEIPRPRYDDRELDVAADVGWAVTRAALYVPFRAVCLPQAIAAKAMLHRRHVANVMHFGVAKQSGRAIDAHAWLDAGPVEVTGYPIRQDFVEVACFL